MTEHTDRDADGVPGGAAPVPARITLALDARGVHGPDVDTACGTYEGNPAGDVDDWELGHAVPTREQVRLLAELTRLPVAFFYQPYEPSPAWICQRTGPKADRCRYVTGEVTPPAAEQPRPGKQAALW